MRLLAGWILAAVLPLPAADRPVWRSVETEDVALSARLVRDREEITRLVGNDLDGEYVLIELDVKPLYNENVQLIRDDFILSAFSDCIRNWQCVPH